MRIRTRMLSPSLAAGITLATAVAGLAAAPALGDGTFSIGKPLIKANGKAALPVNFTQAGNAVLWDAQTLRPCGGPPRVKRVDVSVQQPGTLTLPVSPEPSVKPQLRRGHRVKVPVAVEFTPAGGNVNAPETHVQTVTLRVRSKAGAPAMRRCGPQLQTAY